MVIDRRDFTVPMYSVASSTGLVASVTTSTPIGGMPPPGGAAGPAPSGAERPQAESRQAKATANERGDDEVNADIPATPARGRGASGRGELDVASSSRAGETRSVLRR